MYAHGDYIPVLGYHIRLFNNPFILISHNSDYNIVDDITTQNIVNCPKLIKWYGQNVGYINPKISFLPIGIANRKWPHGDPSFFENIQFEQKTKKTKNVFMNFQTHTNYDKRIVCYNIMISKGVTFLPQVEPKQNIERMKSYKFCICPDGNGYDTHQLWEALYFQCVPILLRSKYSEIVQKETGLPMILLDSWNDFNIDELPDYNSINFTNGKEYLSLEFHKKRILSTI